MNLNNLSLQICLQGMGGHKWGKEENEVESWQIPAANRGNPAG